MTEGRGGGGLWQKCSGKVWHKMFLTCSMCVKLLYVVFIYNKRMLVLGGGKRGVRAGGEVGAGGRWVKLSWLYAWRQNFSTQPLANILSVVVVCLRKMVIWAEKVCGGGLWRNSSGFLFTVKTNPTRARKRQSSEQYYQFLGTRVRDTLLILVRS